jgi:hypothetical protein
VLALLVTNAYPAGSGGSTQRLASYAAFISCGLAKNGSLFGILESERNLMSSKPTLPPLKSGEEPSEVLKLLAFSYIQTLLERGEVQIREALDNEGKPLNPPITIVIFSNTDYQHLTDKLEPHESVGNEEMSVGNQSKERVGNEDEPESDTVGNSDPSVGKPSLLGLAG